MRTATPSSAPSSAWPRRAVVNTTISGPGATACTAWPCASRQPSCAVSRHISTASCSPAATRRSASSITCSTMPKAGPTPTAPRCAGRWPTQHATPASASPCCPCSTSAQDSRRLTCEMTSVASRRTWPTCWPCSRTSPRRTGPCSMPAWPCIRCVRRERSPSRLWPPQWAMSPSTSTSPSRPPRSTIAWPPRGRAPSRGWPLTFHSTRVGSSCTPRTARRPRSTPWRAAALAWCCAPAPRPTWATASPTCRAGSPLACR